MRSGLWSEDTLTKDCLQKYPTGIFIFRTVEGIMIDFLMKSGPVLRIGIDFMQHN